MSSCAVVKAGITEGVVLVATAGLTKDVADFVATIVPVVENFDGAGDA